MSLTAEEQKRLEELEAKEARVKAAQSAQQAPATPRKDEGQPEPWTLRNAIPRAAALYNKNIAEPARGAVGLPGSGEDFSKKLGASQDPLLPSAMKRSASRNFPYSYIQEHLANNSVAKVIGDAYEQTTDPANLLLLPGVLSATAKYAAKGAEKASDFLRSSAVQWGKNATGATGKEIAKYKPGTVEMMLDNRIINYGSTQKGIARKLEKGLEDTGASIGKIIDDLEAAGAPLSHRAELAAKLRARAEQMRQVDDDAVRDAGDELAKIADKFGGATKASQDMGLSSVKTEKTTFGKRGRFDRNRPPVPQAYEDANKAAHDVLSGHIEDLADVVDPTKAKALKAENKKYSQMLDPADAAERRANTLNQHQPLGFYDLVAGSGGSGAGGTVGAFLGKTIFPREAWAPAAGAAIGSTVGGITGAVGRRIVAPRASSTIAAGLNDLSKVFGLASSEPLQKAISVGAITAEKAAQMANSAEGRRAVKLILKDVADKPDDRRRNK